MKLLSVVIQNKKGQNLLMASTPALATKHCVVYSHMIYQHILETFRNRLKIQRTINLEANLICAVEIVKQYILYVFTHKAELALALDGIRKITEHFNRAGSPAVVIPKKLVEYMGCMDEFLYARELVFKESLPLTPQMHSIKKDVDVEIFNKFPQISNTNDRKTIEQTLLLATKVEASDIRKKLRVLQNAQRFQIKGPDEIFSLDIEPDKEKFIYLYKRNITKTGLGKRGLQSMIRGKETSAMGLEGQSEKQMVANVEQSVMVREKERMKAKIREKLTLVLHKEKVKQVNQLGQIFVEGSQAETARLILFEESMWKNPKIISKRISPKSLQCRFLSDCEIEFKTFQNYKSKPIIDYVLRSETFQQNKIPLFFIYTMQVNSTNIEFTFKYKVNQKWKYKIFDFDINVYLNKEFVVLDCKSIPVAHSLKNNKVTWKTKEINVNSSNSKGKILLAFGQAKFPPKSIIQDIRLSMKSNCGLLQGLGAQCKQEGGNVSEAEKMLLISYKIAPN